MEITEKQLDKFAEIYEEEIGVSDLSRVELRNKAEQLLMFADTIYEPIKGG